MDKIVAYCGIVCSDCSAYIATQEEDWAALDLAITLIQKMREA